MVRASAGKVARGMQQTGANESISLSYYVTALRRRARVILVCGLLGVGSAAGYLWAVPQVATATTTVSLNIITNDPFNLSRSASGLIDLEGEAQIADSYAVAEQVVEVLGPEFTTAELRESVSASGLSDTSILRISATGATESQAREVADAVATQYLDFRSGQAQSRIDRSVETSQARLEALREQLAAVNARLSSATTLADSAAVAQAESDRSLITAEIDSVLEQVASIQGIDTTAGSVLNPAARNPITWAPPRTLILATGLLVGLGLGVVAAMVLHSLSSGVRVVRDVMSHGGRELLGELRDKDVHLPPRGAEIDSFRAIRERMLADPQVSLRTGVCGILDECPPGLAGDVPMSLAYVIAQSGLPVEYVALDVSEELLSLARGAFDLRADDAQLEGRGTRFVSGVQSNFSMYVPPAHDAFAEDEPISEAVRAELDVRRQVVLVVLGVPPGTSDATRLAASRLSDEIVLLLGQQVTRVADLERAASDVAHMGGYLMGSVLVSRSRTLARSPVAGRHGERTVKSAPAYGGLD